MKVLSPPEELEQLKDIYGKDNYVEKIIDQISKSFAVLQVRNQMILGLITVCLMISGFSGQKIAETGKLESTLIIGGVSFVLFSGINLFFGPLSLNWMTMMENLSSDKALTRLLEIRNTRTKKYHLSIKLLLSGLSLYVLSLILYIGSAF